MRSAGWLVTWRDDAMTWGTLWPHWAAGLVTLWFVLVVVPRNFATKALTVSLSVCLRLWWCAVCSMAHSLWLIRFKGDWKEGTGGVAQGGSARPCPASLSVSWIVFALGWLSSTNQIIDSLAF